MNILITQRLPLDPYQYIHHSNIYYNDSETPIEQTRLYELIADLDGILTTVVTKIDKDLLNKANRLKIIANYGVGYDNIDVTYAKEKNIIVTNTPYVLTESTAELALILILTLSRKIIEAHKYTTNKKFNMWQPTLLLGKDLYNSTVGIYGFGRIGQRLAQLLSPFNVNIVYHSRAKKRHEELLLNAQYVEFSELLKISDYLIITAPKSELTYHRFTFKEFKSMKKSAYIINVGRGDIIKEDDLIKALNNNFIEGAGLDVYEREPLISEELIKMNNVVLLPHIGSATINTRTAMAELCFQSLKDVLFKHIKPWNII